MDATPAAVDGCDRFHRAAVSSAPKCAQISATRIPSSGRYRQFAVASTLGSQLVAALLLLLGSQHERDVLEFQQRHSAACARQ